jgi:hypothetical protein
MPGTGATSLPGDGLMLPRNGAPTPCTLGQTPKPAARDSSTGSRQGGDVHAVRRGRPLYHTVLPSESANS